ncbi:S1 family serine peptidase [Vibrio navarrensis]|uniref:S1 family serine peptidase n=1 Tax=Vibrio navarrensis TaxID=29495 RepID=UPI00192F74DA|nr:serine protease [Vibrio navarrensis]
MFRMNFVSKALILSGCATLSALSMAKSVTNVEERIIGGEVAQAGAWPTMAVLYRADAESVYKGRFCGGNYIGNGYVVTAAHCVHHSQASSLKVAIGLTELSQAGMQGVIADVERIYVHEAYNAVTSRFDIAILQLKTKPNISGAALANQSYFDSLGPGEELTVIGWGNRAVTGNPDYPNALHQVNVPLVDSDACRALGNGYQNVGDDAFCAGYAQGGKDSCQGDSGGPIWAVGNSSKIQVGVVSWGNGCAQTNAYGVYANVGNLFSWVKSRTAGVDFTQYHDLGYVEFSDIAHEFVVSNNSTQTITFNLKSNSGVTILDDQCSAVPLNNGERCVIKGIIGVNSAKSTSAQLTMQSDSNLVPEIKMEVAYTGIALAANDVASLFSMANSGVFSSEKPWSTNNGTIQSAAITHGEESTLVVKGLEKGYLSFNYSVDSEEKYDGLKVYVNGKKKAFFSGNNVIGTETLTLDQASNEVSFVSMKDEEVTEGSDIATLSNLKFSTSNNASSGSSSGGSLGFIGLALLAGLLRRRG